MLGAPNSLEEFESKFKGPVSLVSVKYLGSALQLSSNGKIVEDSTVALSSRFELEAD